MQPSADMEGAGEELPGANLGSGPRWSLRLVMGMSEEEKYGWEQDVDRIWRLEKENKMLLKRCDAMLEQALSGSVHGDVRFVLEDGSSPLSGHRAVLCAASEVYAGMFRSGMIEGKEGKIRMPPGISVEAYRGLLEWVYLGRAGGECAKADGRELWVLGEMYEVEGMLDWLLLSVDKSNFGAVCEFGLVPEGVNRLVLPMASRSVYAFERPWDAVDEGGVRGVGRDAVKTMAATLAEFGQKQGVRLGWRYVRDAVRLTEWWVQANGGGRGGGDIEESGFREVVAGLDLLGMPLKAIRDVFGACRCVDDAWLSDLVERKQDDGDNSYEVEYKVERRYNLEEFFSDYSRAGNIAFHGEGVERRMAVADIEGNRIAIMNVESGQRVAASTPLTIVPGQCLKAIFGLAFSSAGELYVSDWELNRIHVFDRQGAHVRWFGRSGTEQGRFRHVRGLCFGNDGNLVVADSGNDRVQIIREDGTFVRAFGSRGSGDGMLDQPMDVCCRPDGSIAVLDNGNHRVVVFDRNGVFVRNVGSRGEKPGEFRFPCFVAAGGGGEIIVGDWWRNDVQIFSPEGEVLQVIGPKGDSIVQWPGGDSDECDFGGSADADGRLFIFDGMSVVMLS